MAARCRRVCAALRGVLTCNDRACCLAAVPDSDLAADKVGRDDRSLVLCLLA